MPCALRGRGPCFPAVRVAEPSSQHTPPKPLARAHTHAYTHTRQVGAQRGLGAFIPSGGAGRVSTTLTVRAVALKLRSFLQPCAGLEVSLRLQDGGFPTPRNLGSAWSSGAEPPRLRSSFHLPAQGTLGKGKPARAPISAFLTNSGNATS